MPTKKSKSKAVSKQNNEHVRANFASDAAIERAIALAEADRLEKLPPHERLQEIAKQRQACSDSLMRVNFPTLMAIKAIKGVIMLVVDDHRALQEAIKVAEHTLGPKATQQQILDHAEKNKTRTTLMSVSTFKRNLALVLRMCNGHAEKFGYGSGGGQLKDLFAEAQAAIQEAEKFWERNNTKLTKEMHDFMNNGQTNDEKMFSLILGKNWKEESSLDDDTKKLLGM